MNELVMFNGKVVCPRCDGNGLLYKAKVTDLGNQMIYICDECEASWQDNIPIRRDTFEDLSTYLEKKGCNYRDAEIVNLGYDWYMNS
ncbi:3'-5' exonuclease [Brevibacillus centrosporus]|nr:3'-5' exonuclease [Brevibacillus centrosporus]